MRAAGGREALASGRYGGGGGGTDDDTDDAADDGRLVVLVVVAGNDYVVDLRGVRGMDCRNR